MRIISSDSAVAILNEQFNAITHVASVSVLVEPPYREPAIRIAEPIFRTVEDGFDLIVHEAELCLSLLKTTKADVVHLDMSLGGVSIEELSPVELLNLRASKIGRQNILKILPRLRKVAGDIKRLYGIDTLAIGKESVPVRVAELTAGAEAILFACQKVANEKNALLLGLPLKCQPTVLNNKIYLNSLIESEHDIRGFGLDTQDVLTKVKLTEALNPIARGFRTIKIRPRI